MTETCLNTSEILDSTELQQVKVYTSDSSNIIIHIPRQNSSLDDVRRAIVDVTGHIIPFTLEWENNSLDRISIRNDYDWNHALQYHWNQPPGTLMELFLIDRDGTPVTPSTGSPLYPPARDTISSVNSFSTSSTATQHTISSCTESGHSSHFTHPNTELAWKRGQVLGKGSFGTVYLGLNETTGALLAVKEVVIDDFGIHTQSKIKALHHEISVLENLEHPNIIRYYGMESVNKGFLVFMEYVPGGSIAHLLQQFGAFKETVIQTYIQQSLLGLDYLHQHSIIHRDVKGANILVSSQGEVKLADFGASKFLQDIVTSNSSHQTFVGTIEWMSPEAIQGRSLTLAADIWSLGCVVLEMTFANSPWSHSKINLTEMSAMYYIGSTSAVPVIPNDLLSPLACDFLKSCLRRDPLERSSTKELLNHPWLSALPELSLADDEAPHRNMNISFEEEGENFTFSDELITEESEITDHEDPLSSDERKVLMPSPRHTPNNLLPSPRLNFEPRDAFNNGMPLPVSPLMIPPSHGFPISRDINKWHSPSLHPQRVHSSPNRIPTSPNDVTNSVLNEMSALLRRAQEELQDRDERIEGLQREAMTLRKMLEQDDSNTKRRKLT